MQMNILFYISAFLTGILASMGLGGGMILILYMTLATAALIIHTKNKLVKWKKIVPAIICGVLSAVAGTYIAKSIGNDYLTKIFAVFVLITGVKELFSKTEKSEK